MNYERREVAMHIADDFTMHPGSYWSKSNITGNASGFHKTAAQPASHKVYLKTEDMLYSGGNGTGLSYYIKYAEESTEENPVVIAKGIDERGEEFEQKIKLNDINISNATVVEMRALEAHYHVDRGLSITSLPKETGSMGLSDRTDFIAMFEKNIQDLQKLGKYDLSLFYMRSLSSFILK